MLVHDDSRLSQPPSVARECALTAHCWGWEPWARPRCDPGRARSRSDFRIRFGNHEQEAIGLRDHGEHSIIDRRQFKRSNYVLSRSINELLKTHGRSRKEHRLERRYLSHWRSA